ncbi:MAG: hypothetical protein ACXWT1_22330 [Methylobacter sp.]
MLDGLLDDILKDSPKRGEIRPDSPRIRPPQSLGITELSPNSPNSPSTNVLSGENRRHRFGVKPEDRAAILRWLVYIGETDEAVIDEVLQYCASTPEALAYYLRRAEEAPERQVQCRHCHHSDCFNAHGSSAGFCHAGVQPSGVCFWAETVHPCDRYQPV